MSDDWAVVIGYFCRWRLKIAACHGTNLVRFAVDIDAQFALGWLREKHDLVVGLARAPLEDFEIEKFLILSGNSLLPALDVFVIAAATSFVYREAHIDIRVFVDLAAPYCMNDSATLLRGLF